MIALVALPRYILGIDPGLKTGMSVFDLLAETHLGVEVGWDDYGTQLEKFVDELHPFVVVEKFVINVRTVKNTQAPWSLKGAGCAEQMAMKYGCGYEEQVLSTAKTVFGDERLRALGWYLRGKGHANDSSRQVGLKLLRSGWNHSAITEGLTAADSDDSVDQSENEKDNVISLAERRG